MNAVLFFGKGRVNSMHNISIVYYFCALAPKLLVIKLSIDHPFGTIELCRHYPVLLVQHANWCIVYSHFPSSPL